MNQTNQITQISHWYALRTKSRHEKLVRDRLARHGIEPLLPTVKRLSQWKDRKKEIEVPLFSCYCFVRVSEDNWNTVRRVPGVLEIIGNGRLPVSVSDEEMAGLQKLMASVFPYDAHPFLREGMQVEVIRGPFAGVRGILLRKERACRLVVGIRLIQKAVEVEVDVNDVSCL